MARVETVQLVDDLDGGEADETVDFAVDGRRYEIDLTSANAHKLRSALFDYVTAGRPLAGSTRRLARRATASAADSSTTSVERRQHNNAVRVWARSRGMSISDRGRIPGQVVEAYEQEAGRSGGAPSPRSSASVHFQSAN